jgi:hypothetical protein
MRYTATSPQPADPVWASCQVPSQISGPIDRVAIIVKWVTTRLAAVAVAAAILTVTCAAAASAQGLVAPDDSCIGIIHFPDDPIGDAPSKMIVGVVLPPEYAGDDFTFLLSGASGNQVGMGVVGPDGLGFAEAPLYSYGPHQITEATVSNAVVTPIEVTGIGDGGTYVVDDAEPVCDSTTLTPIPPETTTTSTTSSTTTSTTTTTTTSSTTTTTTTTTTAAPAETTSAPTTTPATGTDTGGGSFPWPGVLIGGGLILLLGGLFVAYGGKKNCDRERENLANAQHRLGEINETLQQALNDMQADEAEIRDLKADLESCNRSKQRGSTTVDGVKYYAHEGGRIPAYELDIEIEYLEGLIGIAEKARTRDEQRVKEWHEKFQKAEQEVRKAEEALAECLGEQVAPTPSPDPQPPETPVSPGPTGPTSPGVTTPPPEEPVQAGCKDGATYSRVGDPETLRPVVDFSVIVTIMEGSERKVGEANALAVGLGEAATALDIVGKALGAGGAAGSIKSGIGGLASGEYVMGAAGLAKGTAEGAMASGLTDISIPTSGPEALVEVLKQSAKLGQFISSKVGDWLKMNQLYDVHLTQFVQVITATPHYNYRCVNGEWKCEKVWQYSVGKLQKYGKPNTRTFRLESDVARHQMQSHINMLGRRAQQAIARSLQDRADFDARHQPGPCQ